MSGVAAVDTVKQFISQCTCVFATLNVNYISVALTTYPFVRSKPPHGSPRTHHTADEGGKTTARRALLRGGSGGDAMPRRWRKEKKEEKEGRRCSYT